MRGEGAGEGFAGSSDTTTANLCTRIVGWVSRVGGWDLRKRKNGGKPRQDREKSVLPDAVYICIRSDANRAHSRWPGSILEFLFHDV